MGRKMCSHTQVFKVYHCSAPSVKLSLFVTFHVGPPWHCHESYLCMYDFMCHLVFFFCMHASMPYHPCHTFWFYVMLRLHVILLGVMLWSCNFMCWCTCDDVVWSGGVWCLALFSNPLVGFKPFLSFIPKLKSFTCSLPGFKMSSVY